MLPRLTRSVAHASKLRSLGGNGLMNNLSGVSRNGYATVAPVTDDSPQKDFPSKSPVNLDKMFWLKPSSLALPKDSPRRIDEPNYEGVRRFVLKLLLFYSKQSMSIRGANVIYKRILSQVDKPPMYEVFNLEKTFKITFSLLVLHMWLVLRRLKEEGKEGVELGQYLYEIYNHDVELRVSKAGVNLLLSKWMKELERIFYGNVVAYDAAMLLEAKPDELQTKLWRNVFCDDGTSKPDDAAVKAVQAMTRYVRREVSCLSLTDKQSMFSGNFLFTSLENKTSGSDGGSKR
ncbi:PREDICTED: ubiquinol-cytochrome-c reductase complex assembly factor 1 [Tarenaya hassleriana]|uniref:ubiquinol-cytochrome-c reductase complex assembly factor 1 n=1 Tax=Tarenaya hassleriana TaxID=28532 RepID=UPI00053C694E|nr:PREDICTED: ubiquinol-cytochrome-c reductase complex assembly factor 1 [Tarenaya hassleriana]XP_010536551.1 PREDICTED: ubiquinol-cytochrome-c reductase complex assembly factor 1 [Tarenaya hassleriana]